MAARAHAFTPQERLHNDRDYARVFQRQQKAAGTHVVVLLRPRPRPSERDRPALGRLGVMVSTKTAPLAVRRHQLKRWVRELFRVQLKCGLVGWDVVVLFRRDPPVDGHRQLDREIADVLAKALASPSRPENRRPRGPRPTRRGAPPPPAGR